MSDEQEILVAEAAKLPKLLANRICADCDEEDPGWASLNLGILLCIKCAGVHRNLGVHISKVRSLTLDTECWDRNQLDFMYAVGNERARQIYEATCPCWYLRPDKNHNDSSLVRENWIRAKYERREFLADVKQSLAISVMPERPREGYLWKANKKGVWQKRFIMLHGRFLYYFKTPNQSYPSGIIDICELTFQLPNGPDPNRRYVFECITSNRTYPFGAESISDMLDWVHALKRSAAYYITILGGDETSAQSIMEQEVLKLSYSQMSDNIKHGFLSKQGGKWKSWNKRLCVVTDQALYYFKKEKPGPSDMPEGGIPLDQCHIANGDAKAEKKYCLCLITPARTYFLCASNDQEKQEWHDVLTSVVERLNPQRLVDFSQMAQPAPIRSNMNLNGDDSD